MHYASEAATVLQWSRLSDHIGRKPILLMSLLGSAISTVLFGLSRSPWALVLRYGFVLFYHIRWLTISDMTAVS
jgi:MFS family permease